MDDAYVKALAEADTCDNSSCLRGNNEAATYTLVVDHFDEGSEEFYEQRFRVCGACNRSCKKSFLGHKIKSRHFDNSTRAVAPDPNALNSPKVVPPGVLREDKLSAQHTGPVPGSAAYAHEHPANAATTDDNVAARMIRQGSATTATALSGIPLDAATPLRDLPDKGVPVATPLDFISTLQDTLRSLNDRPSTPVAFVATVRVKHDALCTHQVDTCTICSNGLVCCSCSSLFNPAAARHLKCTNCKHVAHTCCTTVYCCHCSKLWVPSDLAMPVRVPARRFLGGAGSNSSPEPDIWTPSPHSSPDEIDDLTARAALPLPVSRSESDASRAPSQASSIDEPVNVAATPLL